MKNKIIKGLLVVTMTFLVGCSRDTNNIEEDIQSNGNLNNEISISNEDMYKLHEEILPKIKQLYETNNLEVEEMNLGRKNYTKVTDLRCEGTNNIDELSVINYGISYNDDDNIKYIIGNLVMNIDENSFEKDKFRVEDTIFYNLSNIMINKPIDYTEINNKINNALNNREYKHINTKYENIEEDILISPDQIKYSIAIFPE